ncbi:MAG: RidA family protein [Candidatus Saccharimonadaceae bacterium]
MKSSSFSQVVTTQGNGTTIYIGGQNSVNSNGEVIGKEDIQTQTAQAMYNIKTALTNCGASFDHVVKMSIYIVEGHNPSLAYLASQNVYSFKNPPVITSLIVSALSNPDYLIEIDAIAFLPD